VPFPETPKPATALVHGEPASKIEQLGGPLSIPHTSHTANVQEVRCDLVGSDKAIAGEIMANGAFDLCRRLLAAGADPAAELVCYRNGRLALRIKSIGAGARLTVRETSKDGPRFATWRPFPAARSARPFVKTAIPSILPVRCENAPVVSA
jgi:hypothetical protein